MTRFSCVFLVLISFIACKSKHKSGAGADAATAVAPATETRPALTAPTEPAPPLATKAAEVPALEAKLLTDKAYLAAWERPNERAILLTAISDLVAYGAMHIDAETAVKKAKLADTVAIVNKILARVGKLPSDFQTKLTAYLSAQKTDAHLGTWTPEEKAQPLFDATALAMWLHPDDAGYVRQRVHALVKGPFPSRKETPVARSWLANLGEVIDRLAGLGGLGKDDCLLLGASWSERLLPDGKTDHVCDRPKVTAIAAPTNAPSGEDDIRGPKPAQSAWDGSVLAVDHYLEATLKDPDSYQHDKCSTPHVDGNFWVVECNYRAKNSFGAVVRESQRFFIQKGGLAGEGKVVRAEAIR